MREAWLSYHSIVNDVIIIQIAKIKIDPMPYPNLQTRFGTSKLMVKTTNAGTKPKKNVGTITEICRSSVASRESVFNTFAIMDRSISIP